MVDEKYIGLALAVSSSFAIGISYVITKTGLKQASEKLGFDGDGHEYLRNPIWWCGQLFFVSGELMNFAAYGFAPAILVTPLGALSVLIGAVMGAYFLKEHLGLLGRIGCSVCLLGSVMLILHAPPDKEVSTVDEILHLALQPLFLLYCTFVATTSTYLILKVVPNYGRSNPFVYISICSTVGSISVMAIKALGIAVKLTLAGNNQFNRPSTYAFIIVVAGSVAMQMHYLNKAMHAFSVSLVNALYYVTFTTCTLSASFILYKGFNTSSTQNMISLLSGFLLDFMGVYLLMMSKSDFNEQEPSEESRRFQLLSDTFAESVLSFNPGPSRRSLQSLDRGARDEQTRENLLRRDGEANDGIELEHFDRVKVEQGS
ncbi:DUF803-domain-containing protein [Acephala macrosclerotiorum]|nr:DUF803-domain-containing protein [Acephala macrosclerotiorum]